MMVSFTCENCGDTLKEDIIAQHVGECKGPFPLTCIDCKEEFYDDLYTSHTSCASEVPEVHAKLANIQGNKIEKKSSSRVKTKPSVKAETKLSCKEGTKPSDEVETKSDWMRAIDRLSRSPSLTKQQSSLLEALENLHNVPKNRAAFGKFAQNRWKEADAHEDVINEVFLMIHEQTLSVPVHLPRSVAQEPTWVAALRAVRKKPRKPLMLSLIRKLVDKLLSYYQRGNPVPLSLPDLQSFQNLLSVVCKDSSVDPRTVIYLFNSMTNSMTKVIEKGALETTNAKSPAEEVASKKRKKDRKHTEDVAQIPEKDAQSAGEEVTSKKSKKKKHKRQDVAVEEEDVPRKKSTRSA